jgi:hypothetical protein
VKKVTLLILIFILAVGLYLLYLILSGNLNHVPETSQIEDIQDAVNPTGSLEEIKVSEDQDKASNTNDFLQIEDEPLPAPERYIFTISDVPPMDRLVVDYATMPSDGYLVVFTDRNGRPSEFFARSNFLEQGLQKDVEIKLPKEIKRGEVYHVLVFSDDGDKVAEIPGGDTWYIEENGDYMGKMVVVQ